MLVPILYAYDTKKNKEYKMAKNSAIETETHKLHIKTTETTIISKEYNLFIGGFDNLYGNKQYKLTDLLNELLYNSTNKDTLNIRITSMGGYTNEYIVLANIIDNNFKKRTTTYIDANASSAGAFLFLKGDKRVIYKNSAIMLHNYSGGYFGKQKNIEDRFNFDTKHHKVNLLKATKKYLTKKQYEKMVNGRDIWLDYKKMLKNKIATHIIIDGVMYSRKKAMKKLKI